MVTPGDEDARLAIDLADVPDDPPLPVDTEHRALFGKGRQVDDPEHLVWPCFSAVGLTAHALGNGKALGEGDGQPLHLGHDIAWVQNVGDADVGGEVGEAAAERVCNIARGQHERILGLFVRHEVASLVLSAMTQNKNGFGKDCQKIVERSTFREPT